MSHSVQNNNTEISAEIKPIYLGLYTRAHLGVPQI